MGMNLRLVIAFLPWILFGALSHGHPHFALMAALMMTAAQVLSHRRNPKILELVSLGFFLLDFAALYLLRCEVVARHQGLIVHLILAATAWGSLVAGTPFTLQYAREAAPRERWHERSFLLVNRWITAVWGADFILQAAVLEWQAARGGFLPSLISVCLTAGSLAFTITFPGWMRRRNLSPLPPGCGF